MEPAEIIVHEEHKGWSVELHYDTDGFASNPRDFDNLGTMVCDHGRYTLGDHTPSEYRSDFRSWRQIGRYLGLFEGALGLLPLGLIDHSGISMFVGSGAHWCDPGGWDSGQVGFIFTTEQRIQELCGDGADYRDPEWIEKQLRAEVDEYDKYLRGEVFGYVVKNPDGLDLDSCWGFIGHEYALEEAKSALDSSIEWAAREELKVSRSVAL